MTKIRGGLTPRISWSFWNCYHGNKTRNEQREREVVGWMGRLTGMFQPKSALLGPDSIDVWMIHWKVHRTIHLTIQRKGSLVLEERAPFTSKSPFQTLFNSKGPFGFPNEIPSRKHMSKLLLRMENEEIHRLTHRNIQRDPVLWGRPWMMLGQGLSLKLDLVGWFDG